MKTRSTIRPDRLICDPMFYWVSSIETDVTQTWRKAGWRPRKEVLTEQFRARVKKLLSEPDANKNKLKIVKTNGGRNE